ncbi:hypothetical protein AVEN_37786-1 [Araneus ventricosus]|uniref:Uncharacterized protein n=1 Tax=Araneus ventricosus TaxID=182803 RepID=A0A4Y2NEF1_ARAVE|nr:hypothetical protein AVEN_37786-1 [Araneus ventricosus]
MKKKRSHRLSNYGTTVMGQERKTEEQRNSRLSDMAQHGQEKEPKKQKNKRNRRLAVMAQPLGLAVCPAEDQYTDTHTFFFIISRDGLSEPKTVAITFCLAPLPVDGAARTFANQKQDRDRVT